MSASLQSVTVLGSTGSIGTSTLDVLGRHPERYEVFALSAMSRVAPSSRAEAVIASTILKWTLRR